MKVVGPGSAKPPLEVTSEGSFAIAPFNGARHAYSTLPLGDRIDTREPFFSSLLDSNLTLRHPAWTPTRGHVGFCSGFQASMSASMAALPSG